MGVQLLAGLLLMVVALLLASASIGRSIRRDDKAIAKGDVELRKLRAARRARDANARRQTAEPAEPGAAEIPVTVAAVRRPVVIERRAGGYVVHHVRDEPAPAEAVGRAPAASAAAVDLYLPGMEPAPVASQAAAVSEAEGRAQLEELELDESWAGHGPSARASQY